MNKIIGYNDTEWTIEEIKNSVGPGWSPLIESLISDLFELGWDGYLFQIKEKFGGLRFYIGSASDKVFNRITQAENESYITCERCGAPGEPTGKGWITTLCEKCNETK